MSIRSVEIKAHCPNRDAVMTYLNQHGTYRGHDHQVDTYFQVPNGRLKLRNGTIEKSLIAYLRPNVANQKLSEVSLYRPEDPEQLAKVLKQALPVKVVVDKWRHIFFIDNVKFHVDEVKDLGAFVEIEATDDQGLKSDEDLGIQCTYFQKQLGIIPDQLCRDSYSDMLLDRL